MTMSCSIKMPPNKDKECDKAEFNKTSCGYVTMVDKVYWCADVKKNFTYYEKKHINPVKQCDDVCPTSGSGWSRLTLTKIVFNKKSGSGFSVVKPKPKLLQKLHCRTNKRISTDILLRTNQFEKFACDLYLKLLSTTEILEFKSNLSCSFL